MTKKNINIPEKLVEHILENGEMPSSVFKFCKTIKISEEEFYDSYSSFEAVLGYVWKSFFEQTISKFQKDEMYASFSVKDKLLTFHFGLIEILKKQRSFVLISYKSMEKPLVLKPNSSLYSSKNYVKDYFSGLIYEGQESREIESRLISQLTNQYPELLWRLTLSIVEFWIRDTSNQFEKTDSLIEKSVNTTLDLMGKTPLDGLLDLGKFLYQNAR
ncbi:MAG: TetR family transcriptional regulator C-terminal domain-containing protein [Leadbetterella sp.]